ncbi:GPN1 [Hepatospora eriocheir]|uniref:GPN-loop GTPase n=1 Tax=Hepatospora eriocheir TaxID=1081669 RepID=A0A1X0QJL9_9MICR|nr:GPN1 [Hepatospora eriocheir]
MTYQSIESELKSQFTKINIDGQDLKKTYVVVGMAGSGKTTFCQRLYSWIIEEKVLTTKENSDINGLIKGINLDPAVLNLKMPCHLDIRDEVNIKEVMKEYNLGPNGAINISLNLFFMNKSVVDSFVKPSEHSFTIIDTPGQIESFMWNFPGEFTFNTLNPKDTTILFVIDANQHQISYSSSLYLLMSNLIFAATFSQKYPHFKIILILNKSDMNDYTEFKKFKEDYEYALEVLQNRPIESVSYIGNMATYFEEFYSNIESVELSSLTGEGKDDLLRILKIK